MEEAERSLAESRSDCKALEDRLASTEKQLRDTEAKSDEDKRAIADLEHFRQTLMEEVQGERDQHEKDLAERDFNMDQTRKKYQCRLLEVFRSLRKCLIYLHIAELTQITEGP